ncbi:MAG: amino acid ABC transporter substrate-binding protein [Chloroflexi bacterium]|nr:amino acid ABC transporter substrate-binding protein [Chloroflexota bacterium]
MRKVGILLSIVLILSLIACSGGQSTAPAKKEEPPAKAAAAQKPAEKAQPAQQAAKPAEKATPAGKPAAKAPRTIKLGGTVPATGPQSNEWGPVAKKFIEEWAKLVNEQGGVYVKEYDAKLPVEVVVYDDTSNPDRSVELYEKLGNVDKVDFFFGPASSPITIRASTVAERLKIPMVTSEGNSPTIFARGLQWMVGADSLATFWSENYFKVLKQAIDSGTAKLSTIAYVIEDTPHTKDVAEGARQLAPKLAGLKEVGAEVVPPNTNDFAGVIGKLKGLNPDVVYVGAWAGPSVGFVKQANDLGLDPKELHVIQAHMNGMRFSKDVGSKLADNITSETHDGPFTKGDFKMFREVQKRAGVDDPQAYGWMSIRFVALETILKGIEKAGTLDREKVMDALKSLRYESLYGDFYFTFGTKVGDKTLNGYGNKFLYASQTQGDKIVIIGPPGSETGKYKPRKP